MKLYTTANASHIITERLAELVAKQPVLLLLSGGSAIEVAIDALGALTKQQKLRLSVMVMDERYGAPGHSESNWQKLCAAGLEPVQFTAAPAPLVGIPIEATTELFASEFEDLLDNTKYHVGLFGMGADGHTAGILPGSPAVDALALAIHYQGDDFERVTLTRRALSHLDEAMLFAVGEEKWPVLQKLLSSEPLSENEQPSVLLRDMKELSVFTDMPQ